MLMWTVTSMVTIDDDDDDYYESYNTYIMMIITGEDEGEAEVENINS